MAVKTIQELMAMKQELSDKKLATYEFESSTLGTIRYKKATREEILQISDMDKFDQDSMNVFKHVIEPDLKNPQLQETFNKAKPPHMIVDELFEATEVGELSRLIAGIGSKEAYKMVIKDIKN